jgi:hypothetical protein
MVSVFMYFYGAENLTQRYTQKASHHYNELIFFLLVRVWAVRKRTLVSAFSANAASKFVFTDMEKSSILAQKY